MENSFNAGNSQRIINYERNLLHSTHTAHTHTQIIKKTDNEILLGLRLSEVAAAAAAAVAFLAFLVLAVNMKIGKWEKYLFPKVCVCVCFCRMRIPIQMMVESVGNPCVNLFSLICL